MFGIVRKFMEVVDLIQHIRFHDIIWCKGRLGIAEMIGLEPKVGRLITAKVCGVGGCLTSYKRRTVESWSALEVDLS